MDVQDWLIKLGLSQYAEAFRANDIDGDVLRRLSSDDLRELGVSSLGHRKRLLEAITDLGTIAPRDLGAVTGPLVHPIDTVSQPRSPTGGERRQLTVLFADMVGSTALAQGMDPEDFRGVIRAFQDAAAGAVVRYEGHVAKFMGDGMLAYFGWPRAHEDDPERAVRAGLALIGALKATDGPRARVGIATGLVVVGDVIGEGSAREAAAVGETLNLAARLQEVAGPWSVVVAPRTRALLGQVFELEALGALTLKGIADPVQTWRVTGERAMGSRFEALRGQRLNRLVGRELELTLAMARWEQAKAGEGQVVLLRAEPGIGKSRLVAELRARLEPHLATSLRYQCSPHHVNSALYPVIQQLTRAASLDPGDDEDGASAKLAVLASRSGVEPSRAVPLLAAQLSIPPTATYPAPDMTPPQQKTARLTLLADLLAGLAGTGPILMVVEDLHWVDPTTRELLDLIVGRIETLPVLLVVTFRPEMANPWEGRGHVTLLPLTRLGRREVETLIAEVAQGKPLPAQAVEQIITKTDGIPLFVEELTKTLLESDLLRDHGDRYVLAGPLPALAVPSTLHASLVARLDRLAPVREVAQIGAALGREFDFDLLAAVVPYGSDRLAEALAELQRAELLFPRGLPPRTTWSFKHALIQEAAYETLLKSSRSALHAKIAAVIEARFPALAEAEPERLAKHLSEAGAHDRAGTFWVIAGDRAASRQAAREALAHYEMAIDALERADTVVDRRRRGEINFKRVGLLFQVEGYASTAVENTALDVEQDAEAVGALDLSIRAKGARITLLLSRSQYRSALDICQAVSERHVDALSNPGKELFLTARGVCQYGLGEFLVAEQHFSAAVEAGGDSPTTEPSAAGTMPSVLARYYQASTLFYLGRPDRARFIAEENLRLARRIAHPYSIAWALFGMTRTMHLIGRWSGAIEAAQEGIALSRRYAWEARLGTLLIFQGAAKARCGLLDEGISDMKEGFGAWTRTSGNMSLALWLVDAADAIIGGPRSSVAREWIRLARQNHDISDQQTEAADLLRAEALLARMDDEVDRAETLYRQALSVGVGQAARLLELRAATGLADLLASRSRTSEAIAILAPIYASFTEGFDTFDLTQAKALLDRLT